ncbi:MAG: biopolymer transporter ExbD [Candidatus Cloacimonetes bacterium]|nr:biopolymer transporter ExbD [Candidatus Cloacimonadota bacterium]MCF7813041.1 biopolymer transporter ExbD [Candidatus Cloacimonadota bacterium]MCF7867218.1 biopolymer transporter ExbD [Candidatus Cloacimonadota bacterium]MCF7882662.1 biopolymer transporter ExbD [Candidatus Cloacimonadota bacterium]
MAKIKKAARPETLIPTASMSDIAFLLLLFFMVSTVFVREKGLNVRLPKAEMIQKIPRNHSATIYVSRSGTISIDDMIVSIPDVKYVMQKKLMEDFNVIACFRTDKDTNYGIMSDVMNQLREAETLRVSFEAKLKR